LRELGRGFTAKRLDSPPFLKIRGVSTDETLSERVSKEESMFIQGHLQTVFDALYHMGVIDPVLKMDWGKALEEFHQSGRNYSDIIGVVNSCGGDVTDLVSMLQSYDEKSLSYLAMEVAKEFAEFYGRSTIH
jgi:hypothetical protein